MRQLLLLLTALLGMAMHINCNQCINPFQQIGTKYYYIENHQRLNWFAAAARCLQLGGNLATIENETEMKALNAYLLTHGYNEAPTNWMWISGMGARGTYLAFSNPPKLLPYSKWFTGQPDNFAEIENCVHFYRKGNEFFMNDRNCREVSLFICQSEFSTDLPIDLRNMVNNIVELGIEVLGFIVLTPFLIVWFKSET